MIIKLSAIGDIVHTLPVLDPIRRRYPEAEISWIAERRSAGILEGNELIDNLIEVDTRSLRGGKVVERMLLDAARQIKNLRQFDFDVAIDFQGLLKSAVIAKISGAKQRWGASRADLREPAARVFYTKTTKLPQEAHVIKQNLVLAEAALDLGPTSSITFPISTSADDKAEAAAIIDRVGGKFAILNPAGGWVTKLWHAEKYGKLADRLWDEFGFASVVVTGPKESELARRVADASRSGRTFCTEPGLKGFYELARRGEIYVGGDTGPTHLAIAAGVPIVGIFGPTEWWRNGSLNPADLCVERFDINCRVDCHRRTCSNWICMDIPPETVFDAIKVRLSRVGSFELAG